MNDEKAVNKNISLYPDEWQLVERINKAKGFRNRSQTIRFVIREYDRLQGTDHARTDRVKGQAS